MQWRVPDRFNFARDVVEQRSGPALTFLSAAGEPRDLTSPRSTRARPSGRTASPAEESAPGDRVLVLVGKTPEWHPLMLGVMKARRRRDPVLGDASAQDLAFRVAHSGARLLVADRGAPSRGRWARRASSSSLDAAGPRRERRPRPTADTAATTRPSSSTRPGRRRIRRASCTRTRYCFAKRMQAEHWLDARPGDLVWCTAGRAGRSRSGTSCSGPWSTGAAIVLHEGAFDPSERFELLARARRDRPLPGADRVPADGEAGRPRPLRPLRPAARGLRRRAAEPRGDQVFRDAFGLTIHDGYGQTENTLLVGNFPGAEIRPGSMGLPSPGHEMAVIDEDGLEAPPGEEGDIALARPATVASSSSYWQAPEETAAVFRGELVRHGRPRDARRGRLSLVRGSRGRRDPLGRVPDRPVRGRERPARARGRRRERGRRQARSRPRPDRQGVRRAAAGKRRRARRSSTSCRSTASA